MLSPIEKIEIGYLDITEVHVDAIVNSATIDLLSGSGITGKLFKIEGNKLINQLKELGGCEVGDAKITYATNLPCKRIIHTVGPVYIDGKHSEGILLSMCYKNSLKVLNLNNLDTIAFPSISAREFGFPLDVASKIALNTVIEELKNYPRIQKVIFCCYTKEILKAYQDSYDEIKSNTKEKK